MHEDKIHQPRILYSKNEGKIKTFSEAKTERLQYRHRSTKETSSGRRKTPDTEEEMKNTIKGKICE